MRVEQHIPVLLEPFLNQLGSISGTWIDGTFGEGGYSRALLDGGADRVIGIDCDPDARAWAADCARDHRFAFVGARFGQFDSLALIKACLPVDGVVFDLGVSTRQLTDPQRGFSLSQDGPLDMRMGKRGRTAADLVNEADEETLAGIFFRFGDERAARRIARKITRVRQQNPITSTACLASLVASCVPRTGNRAIHPATRSFMALRMAVNDELQQLEEGLKAAERALRPGGVLAVVSFHSKEDRLVKQFMHGGANQDGANRHLPPGAPSRPRFSLPFRKPVRPDETERKANPRARSARLRIAIRTEAPPRDLKCTLENGAY